VRRRPLLNEPKFEKRDGNVAPAHIVHPTMMRSQHTMTLRYLAATTSHTSPVVGVSSDGPIHHTSVRTKEGVYQCHQLRHHL